MTLSDDTRLGPTRLGDDWDACVERLLASSGFARAERSRRLLAYLVNRAREHGDSPTKEYELGVDVFDRPVSYDPRTDPIVRVGVRELRSRLAAYYASAGAADPVRIHIPNGSYRAQFVPVRPSTPPDGDAVVETPVQPERPLVASGRPRVWLWVALAVVPVLLVAARSIGSGEAERSIPLPATPAVAVLPFANLSGDPSRDYLGEGITDELIGALTSIDGLLVTGRTSAFAFRGTTADPETVGRTLGVDAIVSGGVRLVDDGLRVTARLTSTKGGFELWSRTFAGRDPVALEVEIATSLARALHVRLDPASGQRFVRRSNDNVEAHDLYLRARHLAYTRETDKLAESVTLFERVLRLDPGYALAYAGLADAHGTLAFNGQVEPGVALQRAREAAQRALALDPTLGEALGHLAHLSAFVDWQWAVGERQFRHALELNPSHSRLHAWFGQTLVVQGKLDEALHELQTADRLDPLAASIGYALGEAYLYAGRYDEAVRQGERLIRMDGESWGGHNLVARASIAAGDPARAIPSLQRARGELWADALAFVSSGDSHGARVAIDRGRQPFETTQPFVLASLYASAGETSEALSWLERAFEMRQVDVVSLAVEPALLPLHGHPRFRTLVSQLGLSSALGAVAVSAQRWHTGQ